MARQGTCSQDFPYLCVEGFDTDADPVKPGAGITFQNIFNRCSIRLNGGLNQAENIGA
jgi:hypothetical protein